MAEKAKTQADEAAAVNPKAARRKKRKNERKNARRKAAAKQATVSPAADVADDPMSQCVMLCQESRWREALLLCRRIMADNSAETEDLRMGLTAASNKIEYSLRRQKAAALLIAAKQMLSKEYLLDVGE